MSAIILLILRIGLATVLYAFLAWILITVWRDIRSQEFHLAGSQTYHPLSYQEGQGRSFALRRVRSSGTRATAC
jgi:hypothetical protein